MKIFYKIGGGGGRGGGRFFDLLIFFKILTSIIKINNKKYLKNKSIYIYININNLIRMNELTEEQKEKALKRFVYCQEYYKKYQKEHKNDCL